MKKLILSATLLVVYWFAYSYSSGNLSFASKSEEVLYEMPGMAKSIVLTTAQDPGQDPNQNQDTPTHRYSAGEGCSAVNPNAEPGEELNGVEKNTVGCVCVRKCINGYTQEDLSRDENGAYICRNACHKDRCKCPDPCKN